MKLLTSESNILLILSVLLCTTANQACFASRGDLIAHTVSQQTTVRTYRVVGWQNELTAANPNLGNFYWEPLTKRIINTTRTTSKGATAAPAIVLDKTAHYSKPNHAALPITNVALQTDLAYNQPRSSSGRVAQRTNMLPVLTYQNQPDSYQKNSTLSTVASFSSRESVYGVLKTNSVHSVR